MINSLCACDILASGDISASLVGKLEMAAALTASGDLSAGLNLIVFCVLIYGEECL